MDKVRVVDNILEDGVAKLEEYDFSSANESHESRVKAVTTVASICYNNKDIIGKETLYDRLQAEAKGLPSSSFEFVPVLLPEPLVMAIRKAVNDTYRTPKVEKYGEWVHEGEYLLTNLRALLVDDIAYLLMYGTGIKDSFNTSKKEKQIIKENFKVFHFTAPIFVMRQIMRHRVSWQELSRRYVSAKKKNFIFYETAKVHTDAELKAFTHQHYDNTMLLYNAMIAAKIAPQDARSVVPVSAYTEVWGAFTPSTLKNFLALRRETGTQYETRKFAESIGETDGNTDSN
jgi:thymidylate synthase (FAD)